MYNIIWETLWLFQRNLQAYCKIENETCQNIRAIQSSKDQYIQQIQQVLQFLQELNSQILALRYSPSNIEMGNEIAATIDELLIEMKALEEIT
jgi:hypothetical protein